MDKLHVLEQLASSRLAFYHAMEGLSEEHINQLPVEGIWTVKDLLGHLTAWEEACLIPLRSFAAGGFFVPESIPDHDRWNAMQAQAWRQKSLAEILVAYQAVREELIMLLIALPEERWTVKLPAPWGETTTAAEMFNGLAWHESTEHLKSIQQWKETGKPR